jgi:hypothetical protein
MEQVSKYALRLFIACACMLSNAAVAYAQTAEKSLTFDRTMLRVDYEKLVIRYPGCDSVVVGRDIKLAAKSYLIPLSAGESVSSVRIVSDPEQLGSFADIESLYDNTTADDDFGLLVNAEPAREAPLGFAAGYVSGERRVGQHRYADVLVFPVSLRDDGSAVFHRSVSILVANRIVSEQDLVAQDSLPSAGTWPSKYEPRQAASGNSIEYVVITDSALAPSFAALTRYRNQTGVAATIELIEDIKSQYSGRDDAEKLREYLKQFYADGGRYVLLGGDESILPVRYAYNFNTDTAIDISSQQICDLYFADLTGDWDTDSDNVWGEPYDDHADLDPELLLGRLPFSRPQEVDNYIHKLIAYETSPGNGDPSYLTKAFFFSSDQMRDYSPGGQHYRIAQAYPPVFYVDTTHGVEQTRGDDPEPTNLPAEELVGIVSQGYGIVNIIAHGSNSLFSVRTAGYNNWPKSGLRASLDTTRGDLVSKLTPNGLTSLYYSLACANGAFDYNLPPFNEDAPNLAQTLLGLNDAGAVAFVANSRWGWVSTSYLLQKTFFDSLFAYPERPAVAAMYSSKAAYFYFRDLVYGQNFLGDPAMRVYCRVPEKLSVEVSCTADTLCVTVRSDGTTPAGCRITLSSGDGIAGEYTADNNGRATIVYPFGMGTSYVVTAAKVGSTVAQTSFTPSIALGVDDERSMLPGSFALFQNYPNPFNPTTTIAYDLPRKARVHLAIFNVLGQVVRILEDREVTAGHHEVVWDGRAASGIEVASGIYFFKIEAGNFCDVKKMALVR